MATALKLISGAMTDLSLLAAGQAPKGDALSRMLELLNTLLDFWRVDHALAYVNATTVATLPPGVSSLTIGPGGDFNTDNPSRIELGSFTRASDLDRPLRPVDDAVFNAIALKTTGSTWPEVVNLQRGAGLSTLRFWPLGGCVVHILTRQLLLRFADTTTDYPLAPGYELAIRTNLAVLAQGAFNVAAPAHIVALADSTKRALRDDSVTVPQLDVAGDYQPDAVRGTMFGYAQ